MSAEARGLSLRLRPRGIPCQVVPTRDFDGAPPSDDELGHVFGVSGPERGELRVYRVGSEPTIPVATAASQGDGDGRGFEFVAPGRALARVRPRGERRRSTARARPMAAAVAVAVAVPLTLSGATVHAEPPARPSPAESETGEGHGSEEGNEDGSEEGIEEGNAALETSRPEPAPAPAPAPAPTAVATGDVLALTGDVLWKGVIGHRVRLEVRAAEGRVVVEGELVAQSRDQLALAVSGTGKVASVPKGDVLGIVVDPAPVSDREIPGKTGHGLLIGGGLMLGVGLPLLAVGAAFGGYYQSPAAALGYGLPGGLLLAGGIPMVVIGAKRHREHRKNFGFAGVTPNVRVGRDGAVGGVTLRF